MPHKTIIRLSGVARNPANGFPARLLAHGGGGTLQELDNALRRTSMSNMHRRQMLIRAWEEAVEGVIEDGVVSLDEEAALAQYADHFDLTQEELNRNGAQTTLVQAAVIRDVTQGIIPQRQTLTGAVPFNLMKSEQLIWVIQDVFFGGLAHRKDEVKHRCRTLLQARADALMMKTATPLPSLQNVVPSLALV